MKNNDRLLLFAAAAFSYLFYDQNAGINFLIFDLLLVILFAFRNPLVLKSPKWLWASGLVLLCGIGIFFTSSALAIISNLFCLLLLSAYSSSSKNSVITSMAFSAYSLLLSGAGLMLRVFQPSAAEASSLNRVTKKILVATIILVLSIIFFMLYRGANPLFAANTEWINLDFLSFGWLVFTGFGLLICYGLFNHRGVDKIVYWEQNQAGTGFPAPDAERRKLESNAALWLFVILNAMLLLLNIGDISTLLLGGALPKGVTHTDFVHDGVANDILSIMLACGIIMFVYRYQEANRQNSALRWLVLLWIFQTFVMLISTVDRNCMYVAGFGLTQKRIGVFCWLLAAAIGLVILVYTLARNKGNWYLVRTNVSVWITMLSLSSLVNWDILVLRYNFTHLSFCKQDTYYMGELSDAIIPDLIEFARGNHAEDHADCEPVRQKMQWMLHRKINNYIHNYHNSWQSWDVVDMQVLKALEARHHEK